MSRETEIRKYLSHDIEKEPHNEDDNKTEKPPVAFLPYIAGFSRKVCQDFGIKTVFKSGPTLRSLLTKVKDPIPAEK